VIKSDPLDDAVNVFGEPRKYEAHVATRRRPRDLPSFQDDNRPPPLGDLPRNGQAGKTGANHADIDVEVETKPWTFRTGNAVGFVPARFHALTFARCVRYLVACRRSAPDECMLNWFFCSRNP